MKRNFWKKTAAFTLALTLAAGALPANTAMQDLFGGAVITAHAEVTASGFCGAETNEGGAESVAWSLDDSGVLTISGTGDMADYDFDYDFDFGAWQGQKAPWDAYAAVITSVIIESGVTSIGEQAFKGCTQLTSVTIPDRVTSIGEQAFSSCTNLTSVTIPDSVTSISDNAFYACTSLASVTIPDSVTSIGDKAFYDCTSLTSVTIPGSVTSIGDNAFYDCTSLSTVTIPDSVTSIGNAAFYKCAALDTVIVKGTTPPALLELVFFYTDHNIKIYVPAASVEEYKKAKNWKEYADRIESKVESGNCGAQGDNVKWELDLVTGVLTISGTGAMADYVEQAPPWYVFKGDITSVEIKSGVTSIGESAFYNCTSLTSVTIPDSVTSIGESAFYNCTSLTSVTIPDSVTSIGTSAFDGCSSLTYVNIPNSVTSIGDGVFQGCRSLTSVTIPYSVTSIGGFAFLACSSMTSVTIPDSVTSIGESAFYNCTSLTSVTIPKSVKSIGDSAFARCVNLTSVVIPESVTSIGIRAFYKCAALDTVIVKGTTPPALSMNVFNETAIDLKIFVPAANVEDYKTAENWSAYADRIESKVESGNCGAQGDNVKWELDLVTGVLTISGEGAMADYEEQTAPWYAFNKDITSAEIKSGVTSIGASAFKGCTDLESVIISEGLKSIGAYAFNTCVKLKSVTLPDGLESIEEGAFYYCNQLPAISIPSGVKSIGRAAFETYSLKEAAVKAETPPELEGSLFSDYAIKAIYVPAASVDDYKSDAKWSAYADKISSYELADGQYKQSASKDGTYYTRFVYSVPKAQFAGKSKAKFTATYDGKDYTYETTSYYTGVISNGIEYTAASADSALFVVTISSGSYIYNDLTCTLDFE